MDEKGKLAESHFFLCFIHHDKDWGPKLLTSLPTKVYVNIFNTLASFATMPCVDFLAVKVYNGTQMLYLSIIDVETMGPVGNASVL